MHFHKYSYLEGTHAPLSPSQYKQWFGKSDEQTQNYYETRQAAEIGTKLHALAASHIELGIRMPRTKKTLDCYINDAIGFGMTPEVLLRYSDLCYGSADALVYDDKKKFLRIHDLKTGKIPAGMGQLVVYAALFCLDYADDFRITPGSLSYELRIYQNDDIQVYNPDPDEIAHTVSEIVHKTKVIAKMNTGRY